MRLHIASLIAFFSGFALPCFAKTVTLFEPSGDQVSDYVVLIRELEPGDVLEFNDGAKYEFKAVLGSGRTTKVLKVKPLRSLSQPPYQEFTALRVPIPVTETNLSKGQVRQFIDLTIGEYPKLSQNGIPVPTIYHSLGAQYVEVRLMNPEFDLHEFFQNGHKLDPVKQEKALNRLGQFAAKTARFSKIGDFYPDQVVFDSLLQDWVLLDYTGGSELIRGFDPKQKSVFQEKFRSKLLSENFWSKFRIRLNPFQKKLLKTLDDSVLAKRQSACELISVLGPMFVGKP